MRHVSLRLLLPISAVALLPALALAIGFNLTEKQLEHYGPRAVHGYEVNAQYSVFFQGDTNQLNEYLESVTKTRYATRRITLHVGTTLIGSPWDKDLSKKRREADWSSEIGRPGPNGCDIVVHVWLGRHVDLVGLKVPPGFAVDSGREIDDFIGKLRQREAE